MKTNKAVYRCGKFTDYAGIERPYVLCAVSVEGETIAISDQGKEGTIEVLSKALHIGLSVVHPDDIDRTKETKVDGVKTIVPIYNEEIGKQIAYNKALSPKAKCSSMYVDQKGMITGELVNTLLDQEEKHFIKNPAKYIAGYEKARVEYNFEKLGGEKLLEEVKIKEQELEELYNKLENIDNQSLKN